jgi:hypothetical protein
VMSPRRSYPQVWQCRSVKVSNTASDIAIHSTLAGLRNVLNATAETPRTQRNAPRKEFLVLFLGVFLSVLGVSAVASPLRSSAP